MPARALDRSFVGKYIVGHRNGYRRTGQILELIPVINEDFWLLSVQWAETPVDRAKTDRIKLDHGSEIAVADFAGWPLPGSAAAELDSKEIPADRAETAEAGAVTSTWVRLIESGNYRTGISETRKVLAKDLKPSDVGATFGNFEPTIGANYYIRILNFRRNEDGAKPGVQLWLRHGGVSTRPSYDNDWYVPFDREFDLVVLTPFES